MSSRAAKDSKMEVKADINPVSDLEYDLESCDYDPALEKKLVHKFDWAIMPLFCAAYFFSALDRSNVGNAKVAGMNADIGLTSKQYSNAVSLVYATYLPTMLPGVWLMRMFKRPRLYMGSMVMAWSLVSMFTMFVSGYHSFIVTRVLLGFFEGPYFSCMSLLATDYYLPQEFARRTSFFFVASACSSAFGGLIATGITKIHTGALESWRYLFMIEGLLSFLCGVAMFFLLPDSPATLIHTDEERQVFEARAMKRKNYEGSADFDVKELWSVLDVKIVCSVVVQFCQDVLLYGFSTFLPSILNLSLGYNRLKSQYLTVPVYIFAGLCFLVAAEFSDRTGYRGPIIVICNILALVGYVILVTVEKAGVLYFACYLICFALYIGPGLNESWIANNTAPKFKRGCAIAINQTLGNIAGAISPQVYIHPPKYKLGNYFTIGCVCVATFTTIFLSYYYSRRNIINEKISELGVDDRNQKRTIGDDAPEFRFLI